MAGNSKTVPVQSAPLWRRLCAMVYDALVLVAVWFATVGIYLMANQLLLGSIPAEPIVLQLTLFPLLLLSTFSFYYYFWKKKGQTIGMLAWRLHLRSHQHPLTLKTAFIRWSAALVSLSCFGLGYFYALLRADRLSWHDRVSHTWVVYLSKEQSPY